MPKYQIYAGNELQPRPGVYLITNTVNDKVYIGISANVKRRIHQHFTKGGCVPLLAKAIEKHGPAAFLVTPIYYSVTGTEHLPEVEAILISEHSSAEHGYNIIKASGRVGPYGERFSERLKEAFNKPDVKAATTERVRKMQTAEFVAKRVAKQRATMNTPEFKAKRSAASKAMQSPELKAKKVASLKATMSTQEFKKKRSEASKAMQNELLKARKSEAIRRAYENPEYAQKIAASKIGRIWITDGKSNRSVYPTDEIPVGWWRGKSRKLTC